MSDVRITPAMGELLANALMGGHPATVAYVDGDNRPQISHRGTLQRLGDQQLAMWARNPEGGIVKALAERPTITGLYSDFHDLPNRVFFSFTGRGHVAASEDVRRTVYDNSPQIEQRLDADRKGVAIVIDVDQLSGYLDGKHFQLRRGG